LGYSLRSFPCRWPARFLAGILFLCPVIQGCGGGGSSSPPGIDPDATNAPVSGTIARTEIGGNDLTIRSAWQPTAPAAGNGGFTTRVSQEGAQLLAVADAAGEVRGLVVSVPQGRGRQAANLAVDARSTALAYLWFNPGIIETDPSRAHERLSELESLDAFPALVQYLRDTLPNASLTALVTRQEFQARLAACLDEWWSAGRSRAIEADLDAKGGISVRVLDQSNLEKVSLRITNSAFRYVCLHRRGLHLDGSLAEATKVGIIPGATPLTIGSLGTILRLPLPEAVQSPFMAPSTFIDEVNFRMDTGGCEYWIHGTGHLPGDTPPGDLVAETGDEVMERIGKTVIGYSLMPILEGIVGALGVADRAKAVQAVWDRIQGISGIRDDMVAMVNANTKTEEAVALGKFLWDVLGQTTTLQAVVNALVGAGLITKATAAAVVAGGQLLAAFLAGLQIGTTGANLYKMIDTWFALPEWGMIRVTTSGDLSVEVRSLPHWPRMGGAR